MKRYALTTLLFATLGFVLSWQSPIVSSLATAAHPLSGTIAVNATLAVPTEPVETDMHEFMEYVYQPTYRRLKSAMASAPADNAGWKAIKADSLILAEAGNLTLMRGPEDDVADWNRFCVQTREHGKSLYTAARKKDFDTAHKSYVAMLKSCNACHDQFAGGEHQLTP